jgi:hypothetical protein
MFVASGEATLRKQDTVRHALRGSQTPPFLGVLPYAEFQPGGGVAEGDGCAAARSCGYSLTVRS